MYSFNNDTCHFVKSNLYSYSRKNCKEKEQSRSILQWIFNVHKKVSSGRPWLRIIIELIGFGLNEEIFSSMLWDFIHSLRYVSVILPRDALIEPGTSASAHPEAFQ